MADFEAAFEKTMRHEGGYSNDGTDRGGETKYGISKKAYPALNIKALTLDVAKSIYRMDYWDRIRGDRIDAQEIAEAIFDMAVNLGVAKACALAQEAAGISPADGIMGTRSIGALNNATPDIFLAFFSLRVIARYVDICTRLPDQKRFLLGWVRRALGIGLT